MVRSEHGTTQTTHIVADWKIQLRELFRSSSKKNIVIIGIGHPLRGDDYIGSCILKELKRSSNMIPVNVRLFDAEDSVESAISKLVELKPKYVIFIDTCEMNMKPGEIRLFPVAATEYPFFTTHGIPLKLLSERILPESECWILAVQPKQVEFSNDTSPEVREAGLSILEYVSKLLTEIAN